MLAALSLDRSEIDSIFWMVQIMILWAIILFACAAVAGVFLATRILRGRKTPVLVALIHGGFGAAGLAVLTFVLLSADKFGAPGVALSILLGNAVLGFFLFSRHLRKKPWPTVGVLTHGLIAIVGVSILVLTFITTR